MKVVIQRVKAASVMVDEKNISSIKQGMLVLLGVHTNDTEDDIDYLVKKTSQLRIFDDENGVMNLNISQINGEMMIVSQFTLMASTKKGNRPSYIAAKTPSLAEKMVNDFVVKMENTLKKTIATGVFGAQMEINLINDGPVTIIINSKNKDL